MLEGGSVISQGLNIRQSRVFSFLWSIVGLGILFCLWFLVVEVWSIPPYLLPNPIIVFSAIISSPGYFLVQTGATLYEAVLGLMLAVGGALLVASFMSMFASVRTALLPVVIGLQAVPIVAIAPIFVLWFGTGAASKIAMAALLCWFPSVISAARGLGSIDPAVETVFQIYGASRSQLFLKLRLPSSVAFVISGVRISAGLAMIGAIVAEYVGADRGLGYVITQASYRLETDTLMAAVLCAAIAGIALAELAHLISRLSFSRFVQM
jgi:NitT/TauT family transport system permease protein